MWLAVGCSPSFDDSAPYESVSVQYEFGCREIGVVWSGQDAWESSAETPHSWLYEPMTFELRIQGDTAVLVSGDRSVKLERRSGDDFTPPGCTIPDEFFDDAAVSGADR